MARSDRVGWMLEGALTTALCVLAGVLLGRALILLGQALAP